MWSVSLAGTDISDLIQRSDGCARSKAYGFWEAHYTQKCEDRMPDRQAGLERRIQEQMQHFASCVLRKHGAEADRLGDIPHEVLQIPAVLELMRGWVPLEFGGGWRATADKSEYYDLAGSVLLRTLISEEAAAAAPGLYLALPGPSLTEPIVTVYGTAAQKELFFSSFTGQVPRWGAFAMSEPGA